MGIFVPILVALLAVVAFFLGIFDRPEFVYQDSLLPDGSDLMTIVATSQDQNIGENIMRLLGGAEAAIMASPEGTRLLEAAAESFGGGKVGVGLYFDDPKTMDAPRWAAGWAVQANFNQARAIASEGASASGLEEEPIKTVVIRNSQVLRASIPWRSYFTPMIAPMLHWERGFAKYKEDNGGTAAGLALELYVTDKEGKYKSIEFIVYPDASGPLEEAFGVVEESEPHQDEEIETENGEDEEVIEEEQEGEDEIDEEHDESDGDNYEEHSEDGAVEEE